MWTHGWNIEQLLTEWDNRTNDKIFHSQTKKLLRGDQWHTELGTMNKQDVKQIQNLFWDQLHI